MLLGAAGATLLALPLAGAALAQTPAPSPQDAVKSALEGITYGDPKAPVTVVEYASLACSHCADFNNTILPKIKAEFIDTGQVKLVFKDYPLNAPGLRASMLVHCVGGDRGKALKNALFKTQGAWLNQDYMKHIAQTARLAGVSQQAFDACMANKPLEDTVIQSQQVASQKYAVNSTPTFIINDGAAKIEGANEQALIDALVKAGAKRKPQG